VPPDYLIDVGCSGANGFSLTGPTGTGKTAVALRIAAPVAQGTDWPGR
jgi:DNA helicase TIP49 (TBP-interacting protein)